MCTQFSTENEKICEDKNTIGEKSYPRSGLLTYHHKMCCNLLDYYNKQNVSSCVREIISQTMFGTLATLKLW